MANALFFPSKIQSSPRSGTSRLRVCDVLCDIDGCDQHTFLMAAWADAALLTGKCDEQAVATIWAAHPGEAFAQVAATQKSILPVGMESLLSSAEIAWSSFSAFLTESWP